MGVGNINAGLVGGKAQVVSRSKGLTAANRLIPFSVENMYANHRV